MFLVSQAKEKAIFVNKSNEALNEKDLDDEIAVFKSTRNFNQSTKMLP